MYIFVGKVWVIMIRRFALVLLIALVHYVSVAQSGKLSRSQYIEQYKGLAIKQMKEYGVPASIILAQGMLESDNGNSTLAVKANNHFGIKCHKSWSGPKIYHDDDKRGECFRKYKSAEKSFHDHSEFLRGSKRYAFLFELEPTDYKGWAKGLKKAGYATNSKYAELLIKIIEDNKLYLFDRGVDIKIAPPDREIGKLADDGFTIDIYKQRPVYVRNRIKYIKVKSGDTYASLTKELELMPWQLATYNDIEKTAKLQEGLELYIQPKRRKAERNNSVHVVEEGETMWSISQQYGVKMSSLYSKNRLDKGEEPEVGQVINLRKRKPKDK